MPKTRWQLSEWADLHGEHPEDYRREADTEDRREELSYKQTGELLELLCQLYDGSELIELIIKAEE